MAERVCITHEDVDDLVSFASLHSFGSAQVNEQGMRRIVEEFSGRIPVEIKAIPEGTLLPTRVPVMMVRNTAAGDAWVVPYFELMWLHTWKTMAVSTNSFKQKEVLYELGKETMPLEVFEQWIPYALHDFGARSTGSFEEAEIGIGHLINFDGSDNWPATKRAEDVYYGSFPSHSVAALEHNVVLSWGKDREFELFEIFCKDILTTGRVGSLLIDTYDVDRALRWVANNAERLEEWSKGGGKLVLRPDSGDPTKMPIKVINFLLEVFGYTLYNGYRMLPSWLGVIQGDGNNLGRIKHTCSVLLAEKISLSNIVFGEGGELINNYTRDEMGWAFKVSMYTMRDGTEVPCSKRPKNAPEKHSKEGYFSYSKKRGLTQAPSWEDVEGYDTVYKTSETGTFSLFKSIDSVRKHATQQLLESLNV
jgi:nicotinamide phosphoribosyltransferase